MPLKYLLPSHPQLRMKQIERYDIFLSGHGVNEVYIKEMLRCYFFPRKNRFKKIHNEKRVERFSALIQELRKNKDKIFENDFEKATVNDYFNPFFLIPHLIEAPFGFRQQDIESKNFEILKEAIHHIYPEEAKTKINYIISYNGSETLDLDYILAHPEIPWEWDLISYRPDLTLECIDSHPEIPWDIEGFYSSRPLIFDDYLKSKYHMDWEDFQESIEVNIEDVVAHPELDWNFDIISFNYSLDEVMEYRHLPWNYTQIQRKTHIDTVLAHPEIKWNYHNLHLCPGFNSTYLLKYPDLKWDFRGSLSYRGTSYLIYRKLKQVFNLKLDLEQFYFKDHFCFIKAIFIKEIKLNCLLLVDF